MNVSWCRSDPDQAGRMRSVPGGAFPWLMKIRFSLAIVVMGLSGLVAQILLLRELLIVFSGNELCIGIILANWLILEAFGSYVLGRRVERTGHKLEAFAVITILFSLSLPIAIYLTRILKGLLGVSIGESIGLLTTVYASFLILLPVSVLHGALFTYSCRIYSLVSGQEASSIGRVYVLETAGTIIGGIVCTYLLVPLFNAFQASAGLALLNGVVCLVLTAPCWKAGRLQKIVPVVLVVLILVSGWLVFAGQANRLHQGSVKAQWKNQHIVHYQNSRYGNICIIENQGQYIYFLDGIPGIFTPVPDLAFLEEFVHLPLLAHPGPARLLIVSGGAGGMINEALQHPSVEAIDYAELDPLLLDLLRAHPTPLTESELTDGRVRIEHVDGRLLLNTTRNRYDVIFLGLMEPSSLQANRFFTREFFALVKERLNRGGMLVLGLPGSLAHVNEELRDLNSCIFHTLKSVFPHIRVLPGDGRNLYIASDSREVPMIDTALVRARLKQRKIAAGALVPWHVENKLHRGWQDWFARFLEGGSQKINSDLAPMGLFYSISHWNTLFAPSLRGLFRQIGRIELEAVALLFAVVLLLSFLLRSKSGPSFKAGIALSIMTTGFAGMLFDLMIIFAFQSIYGYVFSWIGLLVASFMAGAAGGALLITRLLERINSFRVFRSIDLAIICTALGSSLFIHALHAYPGGPESSGLLRALFLVISFVCGLLIGSQFPLANKLYLKEGTDLSEAAGALYASDLLGGWFGGIAGAVVLLPVLGLAGTGVFVGLLKLTSFMAVSARHDRRH